MSLSSSMQQVVQNARESARDCNCGQVEPEHLLLALLDNSQIAAHLSEHVRTQLRTELSAHMPQGAEVVARGKLPLSPYSERLLQTAEAIADEGNCEQVEPLHLWIAMQREDRGLVGKLLRGVQIPDGEPAGTNRLEQTAGGLSEGEPSAEPHVNGSSHGLVESLFDDPAPLPTPGDEVDRRLYVARRDGWQAKIKTGWDKAYCYAKSPGEEGFHQLVAGEIYLQRDDEKYCLNCARRLEIVTGNRLYWQFATQK